MGRPKGSTNKVKVEKIQLPKEAVVETLQVKEKETEIVKPNKSVDAMSFYKEGAHYYWAHWKVSGDKAELVEKGPGDVKANAMLEFKVQTVKRMIGKEFEG